jgi:hypothetical protein
MEKQTIETNVVKPKLSIFVEEVEYRIITPETETQLDSGIAEIEKFIANNHGFGETDAVKDLLYADAKSLWNKYAAALRDASFTFYLNRDEYRFLVTLLKDKLEYDVNTVFLAIELTNMLGEWVQSEKHKGDDDVKGFMVDATEITYIYHLIAKHKIKGLTKDTYTFAYTLRKIGDISKIISYYDTAAKNLSKEIQEWVANFEPREEAPTEHATTEESVKAKKLAPKKKREETI